MRIILCASFGMYLTAAGAYSHAYARLVNSTIHSTHPQVRYTPESSCNKDLLGKCTEEYDPFTMSTYVDGDSKKRTFFQTNSRGNKRDNKTMTRTVEVQFYGREAYLFGPPRGQLDHLPGELKIYVDGWHVTDLNLEASYQSEPLESRDPHFIYLWKGDRADKHHVLRLTLWDDADGVWPWFPIRAFGFDSLVVTSRERQGSPTGSSSEVTTLEAITIHDTNFQVSFAPPSLWKRSESPIISSEGFRTFHETSSDAASGRPGTTPVVEFTAQCSAIEVFGAPPAHFATKWGTGKQGRHGRIQICAEGECDYIDTHQAYLNIPVKSSNEPALLHRRSAMFPNSPTVVSMQLLDTHSVMGYVWTMTFSHVLCWKVKPERSWTHPILNGVYDTHVINHQQLSYRPPMHWKIADQYSLATVEPHKLSERLGDLPSWSTIVKGHDIKVYIPALPVSSASHYADIKCCIDGECHHPDLEQWFRKLKGSTLDLPIVHFKDLDPFQQHNISMTALPRQSDSGGAVIAVSRIVYEQVTVEAQPSSGPSSQEPIENPIPSQDMTPPTEPIPDSHDEQPSSKSTSALVVATIAPLLLAYYFLIIKNRGRRGQQTREAQYPDHQERSIGSPASAPNQSISYTQTSRSNPQTGRSDEPRSDEPVLTLPDPLAATGSGSVPGDDVSHHELASSTSDFTVGTDDLTSTPPGSNRLALSVSSSSSPHTRSMRIHSLQDRRPLTPINPDIDYESPFGEQNSPPPVFTGLHTPIPPFVRPTSQRDSADSPRSSSLYSGQTFETDSTYEHIGIARDHNSLGIDEAPSSSEGEAQGSSERAVGV